MLGYENALHFVDLANDSINLQIGSYMPEQLSAAEAKDRLLNKVKELPWIGLLPSFHEHFHNLPKSGRPDSLNGATGQPQIGRDRLPLPAGHRPPIRQRGKRLLRGGREQPGK